MRLKRLEIQGFKSFAYPVCLEFGEGITAIVGPNGSGKSNISDAVRWVLGEQSAKSLRGQRMEDIIFAGSDGKRPLGMAEVQLTLDNSEGFLPVDYREVTVTRRVYRSGDSEFFINKQHCRLRDIHDLFTDTGLGREGYAIIGQGQIEAVLSVRSEDRRVLLEETAGIIKYRQRKEQALTKLEETAVDLLRVSDILRELDGQLESLEEQAKKARLYLNLADRLLQAELDYSALSWDKLEKKLEQIQIKQSQLQEDFSYWNDSCSELEEQKMGLESLILALEKQIDQVQQDLFAAQKAADDGLHAVELYEERLQNHEVRSNQLLELLENSATELMAIASEEQAAQVDFQEILTNIAKQETEINKAQGELVALQEQQRNTTQEVNRLKDEFFDFVRELADKRNFQRSFVEQEKNLQSQLASSRAELNELLSRVKLAEEQIVVLCDSACKVENDLKQLKSLEQEQILKLRELKEGLALVLKDTRQVEELNTQVNARLKTLQELEAGYEGYSLGVRRLMQNLKLAPLVLGTVAEVISVPPGLETAFEVALGSALQNVITANEADAKKLINWLQQAQAGRVTFLPLSSVRGSELGATDKKLLKQQGVLGTGLDLIEFPEQFRPVLASLLGRVIITEDLDSALALKKQLYQFSRLVTRDGSVVFPSGAMTGGSLNNRTSGLLTRKAELEELETKLADYQKQGDQLRVQGQKLVDEIAQLELSLEQIQEQEMQHSLDKQSLAQSQEQARKELATWQSNLAHTNEKVREIEHLLINLDSQSEVAASLVSELEVEEQTRRDAIATEEAKLLTFGKNLEQASLHQTEEQVYLAELKGHLETSRQQLANLEQRKKSNLRIKSGAEAELTELKVEKTVLREKITETLASVELSKINQASLDQSLQAKRRERKDSQEQVSQVSKKLNQAQKEQVQRERALYKGEVELDQLEREQEQIRDSLVEQGLDLEVLLDRKVELTEASLKKTMGELREEIKTLGLVNPAATEEYEKVYKRCEFLRQQLEDLNEAQESLQAVINEMDKLCRIRLMETFSQVQVEFQTIFSQLFNGGKADLVLTDPESILTTGIEVMARPPGKKLQNLLLLSGGERALTAIALLFAIRKVKPTPFCILDEIDAALDESNLGRFTKLMEEFARDTQFLVITHRPKTMEGANTLYGVTMSEDAISQIISVAID